MTIDTLQPVPQPARIGQATAVEQARAVAEVAAAVQVAQACPRDVQRAADEMRVACTRLGMAERAFFRYNRGDGTVTGPSVYLARELARCWGNVQFGVRELRRDDAAGQSEMEAWAWDVQTNARTSTTFIVPHARDVKGEIKPLTALRDVYENNANNAARRLRQMVLALLPQWFVDEATDLCRATLARGDGKPIEERIRASVAAFEALGITRDRVERRIGQPSSAWTAQDIATLTVIYRSLQQGELRVEDEFPMASRVTLDDVAPAPQQSAVPRAGEQPQPRPEPSRTPPQQGEQPAADGGGGRIEQLQWRKIQARFNEIAKERDDLGLVGAGQSQRRRDVMRAILHREVNSPDDLTVADGRTILGDLDGDRGVRVVEAALGIPAEQAPAAAEQAPAGQGQDDPMGGADPDADTEYDPTTEQDWPGAEQTPEQWAGQDGEQQP